MANYNSKITIGTNIDTSKLDGQLSEIQRKLKNLRETGPGGSYSQLAQQYRSEGKEKEAQRIEQYNASIKKRLTSEVASEITKQNQQLADNERRQKNIEGILQRKVFSVEKLAKAQANLNKLTEEHRKISESILETKNRMEASKYGPGAGPFSGREMGFMTKAFQGGIGRGIAGIGRTLLNNPEAMMSVLGAPGTAIQTGGELYKQIATRPERTALAEAEFSKMMSERGRLQLEGRGYEMMYYGPERARALEKASTRVEAEKTSDVTSLIGTTLKAAAVPAILKTLLGAAGGALGGGLAGGVVGAIPGAIAGAKYGLASSSVGLAAGMGALAFGGQMLTDERKQTMFFDREAYEKQMGQIFAGTYEQQKAAEIAKSPEKYLAQQFFERESGRFRKLQRQFGLSDEELFLGPESIFSRATKAGFTMETTQRAMQGISAAGGPTRVATEGGQVAAQLERNLNITNAANLMGKISGVSGMGAIQSKDEIIRMYAEGTRMGLDQSEIRAYMQAAADIQYKTGGDSETIRNLLSAGIEGTGLKTTRGIEASEAALDKFRQETAEKGGVTGQYKLAGYRKLGIRDFNTMAYLQGLPVEQISEEDRYLKAMIDEENRKREEEGKSPITYEQLRKEQARATFRAPGSEEAAKKYLEEKRKLDQMQKEKRPEKDIQEQQIALDKAMAKYAGGIAMQGNLPQDRIQRHSYLEIMAKSAYGEPKEYEAAVKDYEKKFGVKFGAEADGMVNKQEKNRALDQSALLENLKKIEKSSESLSKAFEDSSAIESNAKIAQAGIEALAQAVKGMDQAALANLKGFVEVFQKNKPPQGTSSTPENKVVQNNTGGKVSTGAMGNGDQPTDGL